jgi:excisionase family DNA binding protein
VQFCLTMCLHICREEEVRTLNSAPPIDKRLFTVVEASRYLAISATTLYHWVSRRQIPVVRLRRKAVRLDRQVLDKLIETSTMRTAKEAKKDRTLQARQDLVAELFSSRPPGQ